MSRPVPARFEWKLFEARRDVTSILPEAAAGAWACSLLAELRSTRSAACDVFMSNSLLMASSFSRSRLLFSVSTIYISMTRAPSRLVSTTLTAKKKLVKKRDGIHQAAGLDHPAALMAFIVVYMSATHPLPSHTCDMESMASGHDVKVPHTG